MCLNAASKFSLTDCIILWTYYKKNRVVFHTFRCQMALIPIDVVVENPQQASAEFLPSDNR